MKPTRILATTVASSLAFGLVITSVALAERPDQHKPSRPDANAAVTPRLPVNEGGIADAGPDVIVSQLYDMDSYGAVGGIAGYAIGTTACNIGTFRAEWIANTAHHPVIGGNAYRYKTVNGAGRFEQIGMSWLKHSFCAADEQDQSICPGQYIGEPSCDYLGIHANDTYWAGLNGSQSGLGPRSTVNPWAGTYAYPISGSTGNVIFKELQIHNSDLDPAQNTGATYYGESQYVCTDEPAGNRYNNLTYRQLTLGAFNGSYYPLTLGSASTQHQQEPAINAWKALDGSVSQVNVDVVGDGRMIIAFRAKNLGGGQWHYEYALYNMNCDRAAQAIFIPVPGGILTSNVGFHDVDYHSGEPYSLADWSPARIGGYQSWTTQTFAANPNANALRWGTLYNFRFDAAYPPKFGNASINIFKPGSPTAVTVRVLGPTNCPADIAPGGIGDHVVNVDDLLSVITSWGPCPNPNDCPADIAPPGGDDTVNVDDLLAVITGWGACP